MTTKRPKRSGSIALDLLPRSQRQRIAEELARQARETMHVLEEQAETTVKYANVVCDECPHDEEKS